MRRRPRARAAATKGAAHPAARFAGRGGLAFLLVAGTGVITQGITAISGPLVARLLGPDGRGEMVLITVVALMASQLAVGGLPVAIAHTVGSSRRTARDAVGARVPRWMLHSLVPAAIAAIVVAVLLRSSPSGWAACAGVGFVLTLALIWQLMLAGMVQGEGSVRWLNAYRLAGLGMYALGVTVLFLAVTSSRPLVLLGLYATCICLGMIVGFLALQPARRDGPPADESQLRTFARSSYLSGVGLLDGLGLDLLLVGAVLGKAELGLYSVALSATNLPGVVLTGVSQALLPRLAAAPPERSGALLRRWVLASVAVNVLLILALQAVLSPIIRFAFGDEFVPMITCARILIVAWALLGLRRVLTAVIQAQGRAGYASAVEISCLAGLLAGVVVLGSAHGIDGVAISAALAAAASCTALTVRIDWRTDQSDRAAPSAVPPAPGP